MKYVNNTDIKIANPPVTPAAGEEDDGCLMRVIELMFFAYRDFVGTPDEILARLEFGRAHHRVLHFVNRNPGLPVADLLRILRITKQSLARVLKSLLTEGYIEQRPGTRDRRQRLLYATGKGRDLAVKLADLQAKRLHKALAAAGESNRQVIETFLLAMVDESEGALVGRFLQTAANAQTTGTARGAKST